MPGLTPAAIGSILAALIAGSVSLLGLVIAKEQKTSEFRQQWASELRDEIAEMIARASTLADTYQLQGADQRKWDFNPLREHFVALNVAMTKIRLRLDPARSTSEAVLASLKGYEEQFQREVPEEGELVRLEGELIAGTHQVLNEEWRRIRTGEPIFVAAKLTAAAAILAAATAAVLAS